MMENRKTKPSQESMLIAQMIGEGLLNRQELDDLIYAYRELLDEEEIGALWVAWAVYTSLKTMEDNLNL